MVEYLQISKLAFLHTGYLNTLSYCGSVFKIIESIFSFYVSNTYNVPSSAVKSPGERRRQRQETSVGPF